MFKVFIGSSSEARLCAEVVAELVDESPLFEAVPWWHEEVFRSGMSFLESLFELLGQTSFGIFVARPDDLLIKRNRPSLAVRDNVLFEYGLFAGQLGRRSASLLLIGNADLPSDLVGISHVRAALPRANREKLKRHLRAAVKRCLNDLLLPVPDDYAVALGELREGSANLKSQHLRPLLARAMRDRIAKKKCVGLSDEQIQSLLTEHRCTGRRIVGRSKQRTKLNDFIDLSSMDDGALGKLSATFARFASRYLLKSCTGEPCATRVAVHYKPDLDFLAAVVAGMQVRPALVDLEAGDSCRVKGHCLSGETALFLHDFTTTGFTPLECIAELNRRSVRTPRIVSFFVREENLEALRNHCASHNVKFHVFCVQRKSGNLDLGGDRG
jgi:hypothetical protein